MNRLSTASRSGLAAERPYGVEAILRDNSGNWCVLVEPREYTGEDFAH